MAYLQLETWNDRWIRKYDFIKEYELNKDSAISFMHYHRKNKNMINANLVNVGYLEAYQKEIERLKLIGSENFIFLNDICGFKVIEINNEANKFKPIFNYPTFSSFINNDLFNIFEENIIKINVSRYLQPWAEISTKMSNRVKFWIRKNKIQVNNN